MNKLELKQKLDGLDVSPLYYSLEGDLLPDRIILYQNYGKWDVFYFDERGNRDWEKIFTSENEACKYIYDYFKNQKEIKDSSSDRLK